jgi:hypothetical protein
LRASEAHRKPSSSWDDQLSEAKEHLTTQVTATRQSGHVGETEPPSRTFLETAPDRSTTHVKSGEQPWPTSSLTALRTSGPPLKPSSRKPSTRSPSRSRIDQLSDATVHPTTQVTLSEQSGHVSETELSSRTVLNFAPEPSSTHTNSGKQLWPTSSVTALRTSEPPGKPSSSWHDQLSEATVHPTAQVTVKRQSSYVEKLSHPLIHFWLSRLTGQALTKAAESNSGLRVRVVWRRVGHLAYPSGRMWHCSTATLPCSRFRRAGGKFNSIASLTGGKSPKERC